MKTNKNQKTTNKEINITKDQSSNVEKLQSRSEQVANDKKEEKAQTQPNSQPSTNNPQPVWTGVFFNGPEPEQDREGEEIPVWTVYVGDVDANPVSRVYRVFSFTRAESLAQAMSKDRNLELIAEAQAA